MKISSNWLREHLDYGLDASALSEALLRLGFEVSGVERRGPAFSGVVVARVVSREKHPNADKLSVCVVDDGTGTRNVVCGAPNVAAGQLVAFARVGAALPGGHKIGKAKLRGVESQGMICSREELGLPKDGDGIWVLGGAPAAGCDVRTLVGPPDDMLDVEVTPNRPDCLSHRGLARELAVALGKPLKPLPPEPREPAAGPAPSVSIEDPDACWSYGARLIEGVRVAESPDWLKARLESIGLRPVNNVVDVTNFALHDVGQPLHAFDADRLAGGRLAVRRSKAGEPFRALDHKTHALPAGLLVIADAERPVALAGVMGGEDSAVTGATARVVLEGAYFGPAEVRRSSQATRLRSDSSYRFERGADPEAARWAAARAAALIVELAGGRLASRAETSPRAPRPPTIKASAARLNAILGTSLPEAEILRVLGPIAAGLSGDASGFAFVPPSWRHDLATPNDLAEEAARLLGYDKIPARLPRRAATVMGMTPVARTSRLLRARARALGLSEAYNYDLLSEKALAAARLPSDALPRVSNPLSEDWAVLRPSLLPGLLKNARYNLARGADAVRLFELGKTYATGASGVREGWRAAAVLLGPVLDARWQPARAPRAGFHDAKAVVEEWLAGEEIHWVPLADPPAGRTPSDPLFHPVNAARAVVGDTPVATAGWLHPRVARAHDLEREGAVLTDLDLEWLAGRTRPRPRLKPIPSQPVSRRDLALVVDKALAYEHVLRTIRGARVAELRDALLFDVYEGPGIPAGKKSLAVRLTFGRDDRALTDVEISGFVSAIVTALGTDVGAVLRS